MVLFCISLRRIHYPIQCFSLFLRKIQYPMQGFGCKHSVSSSNLNYVGEYLLQNRQPVLCFALLNCNKIRSLRTKSLLCNSRLQSTILGTKVFSVPEEVKKGATQHQFQTTARYSPDQLQKRVFQSTRTYSDQNCSNVTQTLCLNSLC